MGIVVDRVADVMDVTAPISSPDPDLAPNWIPSICRVLSIVEIIWCCWWMSIKLLDTKTFTLLEEVQKS